MKLIFIALDKFASIENICFIYTTIVVCKINPYFSSKVLAGRYQSWRSKSSSDEEMTKAYSAKTQTVDLRHTIKMVEAVDNQRLPESSHNSSCTGLTNSDFCNTSSQINKSTDCQNIDTLFNPVVNTDFARDIDNQPSKESNLSPEVIHSTVIMNPSHIPNPAAEALGNNKSKKNFISVYGRKKEECTGGSNKEFMMINTSSDNLKPEVFPKNMC